jgi:hypothetical protein
VFDEFACCMWCSLHLMPWFPVMGSMLRAEHLPRSSPWHIVLQVLGAVEQVICSAAGDQTPMIVMTSCAAGLT